MHSNKELTIYQVTYMFVVNVTFKLVLLMKCVTKIFICYFVIKLIICSVVMQQMICNAVQQIICNVGLMLP